MRISTIRGTPASRLGLAAHPEQDPRCVARAAELGINFFFFYSPGTNPFVEALRSVVCKQRDDFIVASGTGARSKSGLQAARRKILSAAGIDVIDIFFAEYIHPGDDPVAIFGVGGVLDELQRWKSDGVIRYVGASAHDRVLAKRLAEDARVDILMHRYNMAHRKAEDEVFPAAEKSQTPMIAFTATRWGTLLEPHSNWSGELPTAADCYRFCLAQSAVEVVLSAPKTVQELDENLAVLKLPSMNDDARRLWERYGDIVYERGGRRSHDFESRWP